MHDLIPHLSPQELGFVDALDKELAKIEEFYDARKKEMEVRTKMLEAQLIELNVHHRRFHVRLIPKPCYLADIGVGCRKPRSRRKDGYLSFF